MPGQYFSSQGKRRKARSRRIAAISFALALLSASLDHANAQTMPSAPSDELLLRFAPPPATSVREQYVSVMVFWSLLVRFRATAPAFGLCGLSVRSTDRFEAFRLIVNPPRPEQRANCLRQLVRFTLQGEIGEAEFVAARREQARFMVKWTNPSARFPEDAVFASERLAYRVIYQDKSPVHQLNSITSEDYANLRFADFIQWVNASRRDGLMTFDGDPSMLEALDLKPAGQWEHMSLSSAFLLPGVFFYEGERLGVPAMIMIRVTAAGLKLRDSEIWKRFSCNRRAPSSPDLPASSPISGASCFSHSNFDAGHWVGLAIRKTPDADDTGFCVAVKEFANRPDIASFTRDASPDLLRPYVLLPESCRATTSSP